MNGRLLTNSLVLSLGATSLALLWGAVVAVFMTSLSARHRGWLCIFVLLTFAMPPFLVASTWMERLASGASGGAVLVSTTPLGSVPGAIVLMAGQTWPLACLGFLAAWTRIPRELYECDPELTGWLFFRHLLWPEAKSMVPLLTTVILLLNLNQFTIPSLLQIPVILADVWTQYSTHLSASRALWAAWPLVVIPVILAWMTRQVPTASVHSIESITSTHFARRIGLQYRVITGLSATLILLTFLVAPLWTLIRSSVTWHDWIPAFEAARRAWFCSMLYAAITATILCVVPLWFHTRSLHRQIGGRFPNVRSHRIQRGVGYGMWLLFFVPEILMAIGLLTAVSSVQMLGGLRNSSAFVLLGLGLRYSAIGWHGVQGAMRRLNPDLMESTVLTGATMRETLHRFILPALLPRLLATWYAIYVFVLWDVETPLLLQAPGGETLALRIFNLLHYGHNSHVNALCLHMLLLALLPALGWGAVRFFSQAWKPVSGRSLVGLLILPCVLWGVGCSPESKTQHVDKAPSLFKNVEIVGGRGTASGEFNKPRTVTVDRQDNLYVVDMTGRVQKFSPDGRFLLMWQLPQTDLGKPKGMTCDSEGNIIVVEPHYQRVNHFSPEGKLLHQWGVPGTQPGQLTLPRSVACNSKGWVFLTEYTTVDRVQAFVAPQGEPRMLFGRPGNGPGEFNRAESVRIGASNQVYVADSCNHRIQIFSPEGKFLRTYGRPGSGVGEMSYPYDICMDAKGRQYVCEFGNSRIQIFDAEDHPIEVLGGYGTEPGKLSNPWSITLDSRGNLYVADSGNHRVQKFTTRTEATP